MGSGYSPNLDGNCEMIVEALDVFQDGIFALDSGWIFIYLNKRAAEIIEHESEDILGKNLWESFPEIKGTSFEENYRLSMQNREVRRFETESIRSKTWFEVTVYPSKEGIIVNWHDISKCKKAQEIFDEENLILKGIIESTGAMMAYLDLDFNFVIVNSAYANGSGYSVDELIGKNHFVLFPNKENQVIFEKVRDTGQPVKFLDKSFEFKNQPRRGVTYWDWTLSPVKDEQGIVQGVILTLIETTERKKAEEALKQSNERFSKLFYASQAAIVITRLVDGYFIDVNESFLRLFEYSREEVIGHKSTQLNIYSNPCERAELVKLLQKKGIIRNYEISVQTKTGKPLRMLVSIDKINLNGQDCVISTLIDITERKKAEEALLKANEQTELERKRLETILETTPSAVVIVEAPDGKISYANRRALQLYGFDTVGLSLNTNLAKVKPERIDGSPYPFEEVPARRALKGQEVRNEEMILERANGTRFPIIASTAPIRDAKGKITAAIAVFEDITERIKARQQLELEKLRLDLTINQMPDAVAIADAQTNQITKSNNQFEQVWGLPFKQDMTLEEFAQTYRIFHLDGTPYGIDERPLLRSIKQGEVITREEALFYRRDGSFGFLQISSAPIKEAGSIVGAVFIHNDVTERKRAEEAVQRQAELINLSPDAIIVRKLDGTITFWSKGAEKLYGWAQQEAIGQKTDTLLNTQFPESLENIFGELRRTTHWTGELIHRTKDNRTVIVQSYWLAIFGHGEIAEIFESHMDITERKKLQERLEEYSANLEHLAQERLEKLKVVERLATIGQVAGMVGHDIRNPLQIIISELYLAKTKLEEIPKGPSEGAIKESIGIIEKQTNYIDKVVMDLQDLARPLKPELVEADLCSAVPEVVSTIAVPDNIQSSIVCDVPPLNLKIDLAFLRRIMVNLMTNAVQAMPNGGRLTIKVFRKEGNVVITIEDTGVGIPKEAQDRLFTPLFTTKAKGQGFGLVVIKRMTDALGGTISFESQEGKGTKFTVTLPVSPKS